jgi:hypothetical protein
MLPSAKNLDTPNNFNEIKHHHDSKFVVFNYWIAFDYLEKNILHEIRKNERTLYLNHHLKGSTLSQIPMESPLALQNNSDCVVLDLTISYSATHDKVFYLNKLPPKKIIQLKIIKAGNYNVSYSLTETKNLEKKVIKIITTPSHESHIPHNFDLKLRNINYESPNSIITGWGHNRYRKY